MTSSLTWVDYDSEARDRSLRILSLFQQRESRDELGLGAIRDSFADKLFPGTSTIQAGVWATKTGRIVSLPDKSADGCAN